MSEKELKSGAAPCCLDKCGAVAVTRFAMIGLLILATHTLSFAQGTAGISIKVHTESGAAIAGVQVRVDASGGFSRQALTDAEGQAEVAGLAAGDYNIVVAGEGFEPSTQSVIVRDE